jgi:hypothetical protein
MMRIGYVRMYMPHGLVAVQVTMLSYWRVLMGVQMMPIIMRMGVLMFKGLVVMFMSM